MENNPSRLPEVVYIRRVPVRLMTLLLPVIAVSLSACCGVAGTTTVRSETGDGVDTITLHTRGGELRTAPGCRGLSLGWRRTTLVYPAGTLTDPLQRRAHGWSALPSVAPLFMECSGTGLDFAIEPSSCGLSAGRYSRAAARLPLTSSAVLLVRTAGTTVPHFSYHPTP